MIGSRAEPRSAEERRARSNRHPARLCARGQGDPTAADVDYRGVRIVRVARVRRVQRTAAKSPPRLRRARVRRGRPDHARNALLTKSAAGRRRDGGRRIRRAVRGSDQWLFRSGVGRRDPRVRLAGDDPGPELRDPGPTRRLGTCDRRGDPRGHAAVASALARQPSTRCGRRAARGRGLRRRGRRTVERTGTRGTRGSRRSRSELPRHAASPDRAYRADRRARIAPRRARLAPVVPRAVNRAAGARARVCGGRGSDGGDGRCPTRQRRPARR